MPSPCSFSNQNPCPIVEIIRNSTPVKITLLALGSLAIGGGIALYFFPINSISAYFVGGAGIATLLTVAISSIKQETSNPPPIEDEQLKQEPTNPPVEKQPKNQESTKTPDPLVPEIVQKKTGEEVKVIENLHICYLNSRSKDEFENKKITFQGVDIKNFTFCTADSLDKMASLSSLDRILVIYAPTRTSDAVAFGHDTYIGSLYLKCKEEQIPIALHIFPISRFQPIGHINIFKDNKECILSQLVSDNRISYASYENLSVPYRKKHDQFLNTFFGNA
ncbi:MAG: hypothetical protein K940chlam9_01555 [Chlamydiae bacterium]|nr:hypothetical protein [Chlamydiota bacterium]